MEALSPEALSPGELDAMLLEVIDQCSGLAAVDAQSAKKTTARGTPCAKAWDDPWIQRVQDTEDRLDRNICGARTPSGDPCTLPSNHPSGRCRFHGGFDLTGAPKGNRNAVIHGLYSRRLQTCGPHCARWETCPCAGQDVLDLPPPGRPTCPYEQTEYNTFLADARAQFGHAPLARHDAHHLALLHVMVGRAAAALAVQPLTETTTIDAPNYRFESSRASASFQAFSRLCAEFRATRKLLLDAHRVDPDQAWTEPSTDDFVRQSISARQDTRLDPDALPMIAPAEDPSAETANQLIRMAFRHAAAGRDVPMLETMLRAAMISPVRAALYEDRILASYRPQGKTMPPDAVKCIYRRLRLKDNLHCANPPPKSGEIGERSGTQPTFQE